MKIISHRGNLTKDTVGNHEIENNPDQIRKTLFEFDCEIDLWYLNDRLYLGHDGPDNEVDNAFLQKKGLWIHCKNIAALQWCRDNYIEHYFAHDKDPAVLTSSNWIWTFPEPALPLFPYSIAVVYNRDRTIWPLEEITKCHAICTDDPAYFDELFNRSQKSFSSEW